MIIIMMTRNPFGGSSGVILKRRRGFFWSAALAGYRVVRRRLKRSLPKRFLGNLVSGFILEMGPLKMITDSAAGSCVGPEFEDFLWRTIITRAVRELVEEADHIVFEEEISVVSNVCL